MRSTLKFIYTLGLISVITVGTLLLVTLIPIPGLDLDARVVQSGSMEPAIRTGSVIFTLPAEEYKIDDIITYQTAEGETPTTHRIVDKDPEQNSFTTQGDANTAQDIDAVEDTSIIGSVRFHIPFLGYPINFARQPLGFLLFLLIPAGLIIADQFKNIIRELDKMESNQPQKKHRPDKNLQPENETVTSSPNTEQSITEAQKPLNRELDSRKDLKKLKFPGKKEYGHYFKMNKISIATKTLFLFCCLMLLSVFAMSESGAFFTNQAELLGVTISTGPWEEPSQPEPGSVVISEIMWMGTIGTNPSDQPIPEDHDRFIELFNTSEGDIDIGGWTITNARSGNNDLTIPENSVIKANSRFLIAHREVEDSNFTAERGSVQAVHLQQKYHANGQLLLRDAEQTTIDATPEIIDNPQDWPAGEDTTESQPYRASMMRTDPYSSGNDNWHTCNMDNISDNEIDEMKDLWRKESRPYNCGLPGRKNNSTGSISSLPESEKKEQNTPETATSTGNNTPQKENQSQEDLNSDQPSQPEARKDTTTDPKPDQEENEEDDENNEDKEQKEEKPSEQESQNRQDQQQETDSGNNNSSSDEGGPDETNDENEQSEYEQKDKEEKNNDDNNEDKKEDQDVETGTSTNTDFATEN